MLSLGMKIAKNVAFKNSQQIVRHSSAWVYRSGPKPLPKSTYFVADFVGATMWWWILWHLFTEPEHITGEFPYPDPRKWTNEELGIPEE
ncbi:NADH dehydrogenase [ubiquinone] 1 beta subcomplex subunit 2, mitochondrial-like isoform X2 [Chrysoperla carnea]|uniref:NADH dehydrogenase [ubiquinone] 1 beta subcomplex subunit 2, mitochondrial-like isoform X2 n=1 Tax=Chrysoperla carnea TaxID=189513 RepID=UPI001D05EA7E|nr:NADH dehydrogenase [ubiquinone] 1 beta subcomplex subunit 2, mitochondrial-like isoform X2 [Chrysoperla carnea]